EGGALTRDGALSFAQQPGGAVGAKSLANQEDRQYGRDEDDHQRHDQRMAVAVGDEANEILLRHGDQDEPVAPRSRQRGSRDDVGLSPEIDHIAPGTIGAEVVISPSRSRIAELVDSGWPRFTLPLVDHDAGRRRGDELP